MPKKNFSKTDNNLKNELADSINDFATRDNRYSASTRCGSFAMEVNNSQSSSTSSSFWSECNIQIDPATGCPIASENDDPLHFSESIDQSISKNDMHVVRPTMVYFGITGKRIEGRYLKQKKDTSPAVLILPPDPRCNCRQPVADMGQQTLHETISNEIVKIIEKQFQKQGFTTLAINYQGSGKSEGIFREFRDGVMTASTSLDWLQSQNTEASHFWIAGYSFGACVAADISMRRPEIENFIFVSPLIEKYDISFMCPSLCNGLVVVGEKDEFTDNNKLDKLITKMNEGSYNVTVVNSTIENAKHDFSNQQKQLEAIIYNYIGEKLSTRIPIPIRKKRRKRQKKESLS